MTTHRTCISCTGPIGEIGPYLFSGDAFKKVLRNDRLFKCGSCTLVQVSHKDIKLDALLPYYKNDYRSDQPTQLAKNDALRRIFEIRGEVFATIIAKWFEGSPKNIYELGTGYGYNLEQIRKKFPKLNVYSDEPDADHIDVDIIEGTLEERTHDVILVSHVLEHLTPLHVWLGRFIESLAPGGLLIIEVPNDSNYFLSCQETIEPHITFFNKEALRQFLTPYLSDLQILDLYTTGEGTEIYAPINHHATTKFLFRVARRLRGIALLDSLIHWFRTKSPNYKRKREQCISKLLTKDPENAEEAERGWLLRAVLRKRP